MIDRNTNVQITDEALAFAKVMLAEVPFKCCSKCNIEKSINDFPIVFGHKRKDGTKKQRYHSQCRECRYSVCRKWLDKNEGYSTIKKREWDEKNKEYVTEYKKNYKKENADKVKQWKKDWDIKNKEHRLQYNKDNPQPKHKVREWQNATAKKMREELNDCYVIYTLSKRIGKKADFIRQYPELIETQRLIIKTQRLCKTSQN